jgi:carbamoyltransferase
MDLAAWVQRETETILIGLISQLAAEHRTRNVCLAGGVAMNCVANQALRRALDIDVYVTPPASDRGQALGNALHGMHRLTGTVPRLRLDCDTFGRSYSEEEIRLALRRHPASGLVQRHPRHGFSYAPDSDPALAAAQLLGDGKLVGWFEGGSELGARALGRRSILADPRTAATRDSLNTRIKHREWFRPFAPAVVDERRELWFALDQPSPFMLYAASVRELQRDRLAAVTHVDGSARVQTVDHKAQPEFHRLISEFGRITGVPVVLNTSFNDREPIVETPAHALATFCATDLDALIIGNFVVVKDDQ